jgi:hypothetical protein
MRYAEYIKEIEELQQTPLPLGQEWVRIPIRSAEQFRKCKEHRIDMYSDTINHGNGHVYEIWYIYVKFDDIINLFD